MRSKVATQWKDLGAQLLLSTHKVDIIHHDHPYDAETCCTEMFKTWLREDTEASWAKLVDALRAPSVAQFVLASDIERQFMGRRSTM